MHRKNYANVEIHLNAEGFISKIHVYLTIVEGF